MSAPGLKDVESHQELVETILREPLQKQQKRKERDRGKSEAQRFNALILCQNRSSDTMSESKHESSKMKKSAEASNNLEKRRDNRHKEIGGSAHSPTITKGKPLGLHLY